jgi:DHA1 family bicyclomycin/chloramphenicol resistance-like MFS transporter
MGYIVGNFITARHSVRTGINPMIITGSTVCALGVLLSLLLFAFGYGSPLSFFGLMTFVGFGNGLVLPNAIAGTLSVRPQLAGTASGLGGSLMIGGGAALSALAGMLVVGAAGAERLLLLQGAASLTGLAATAFIVRRERRLARQR